MCLLSLEDKRLPCLDSVVVFWLEQEAGDIKCLLVESNMNSSFCSIGR